MSEITLARTMTETHTRRFFMRGSLKPLGSEMQVGDGMLIVSDIPPPARNKTEQPRAEPGFLLPLRTGLGQDLGECCLQVCCNLRKAGRRKVFTCIL